MRDWNVCEHCNLYLPVNATHCPQCMQPMVLDAATGTGRFLSFVLDNWADEIDATALDLSPFYLQRARATLRRWAGPGLSFAEANVEAIPFPDASFDAITCVYLFHGAAFGR